MVSLMKNLTIVSMILFIAVEDIYAPEDPSIPNFDSLAIVDSSEYSDIYVTHEEIIPPQNVVEPLPEDFDEREIGCTNAIVRQLGGDSAEACFKYTYNNVLRENLRSTIFTLYYIHHLYNSILIDLSFTPQEFCDSGSLSTAVSFIEINKGICDAQMQEKFPGVQDDALGAFSNAFFRHKQSDFDPETYPRIYFDQMLRLTPLKSTVQSPAQWCADI